MPGTEDAKGAVAIEGLETHVIFIPDEVTPFTRATVSKDGVPGRMGPINPSGI